MNWTTYETCFMRPVPLLPAILMAGVFLSLTLVQAQVHAQTDGQRLVVETITLEHRAPERIREAIRPQLMPGARIGQIGEHLIVASSRDNLAHLRAEIDALDQPLVPLHISVDFGYGHEEPTSVEARVVKEDELTWFDAGELHLGLRATIQGDQILLVYALTESIDQLPERRILLRPGQWHELESLSEAAGLPQALNPADILVPPVDDAESSAERVAIRIEPAA